MGAEAGAPKKAPASDTRLTKRTRSFAGSLSEKSEAAEARPSGKTLSSEAGLPEKSHSTGARTSKKSRPSEAPLSKKTSSQGSRRQTETSISSALPHKTPAPAARSQAKRPAQEATHQTGPRPRQPQRRSQLRRPSPPRHPRNAGEIHSAACCGNRAAAFGKNYAVPIDNSHPSC